MAKVTAPLISIGGRGQLGKTIVFADWRGVKYARQHVVPANPQSTEQTVTRNTFSMLQNLWKRMGALSQAPWIAFATGKKFTDRNAITSKNVTALRGQANNNDFVGSPGANGGVAPTAVAAVGGGGSGEIDVTVTSPPTPTGWTLVSAIAVAIEQGDPVDLVPDPIVEGEVAVPVEDGDNDFTLSGLTAGTTYVVTGWLQWEKPDGTTAYGASLGTTAAATA